MDSKLLKKISNREEKGTLRSLSSFDGCIDFFSNDYLGASKLKTNSDSDSYGSTGSRLISGSNKYTISCEKRLADFFGAEKALVYNSGYDANIGFFSSVPQKGDTVIYDEYIHASIRDGIRLSYCESYSFKHNDLIDFKRKLKLSKGTVYVSIESLYSMDGDISLIEQIATICNARGAYLIIDEAHAVGVFGNLGKGIVDLLNINELIFARLVTFGKAYGSHGAAILGNENLINYLTNFSRSFIYTTALPQESYFRIEQLLNDSRLNLERVKLRDNIDYFCKIFASYKSDSNKKSPIQLLKFGNITLTKEIALKVQGYGLAVKPMFSPTVPIGSEGLRICLHSFNTIEEIDLLYNTLL